MSIEDNQKKINSIYGFLVILLAGTLCIGIIRILPVSTPDITVSQVSNVLTSGASKDIAKGQVVASKNSKIYHLPTCPGAKAIKSENKLTFASKELAEKAGLVPAKNCKGLK